MTIRVADHAGRVIPEERGQVSELVRGDITPCLDGGKVVAFSQLENAHPAVGEMPPADGLEFVSRCGFSEHVDEGARLAVKQNGRPVGRRHIEDAEIDVLTWPKLPGLM